MFKKIFISLFLCAFLCIGTAYAAPLSQQQINKNFVRETEPLSASAGVFRDSLAGIISQLQALKPLIQQAEAAQPRHTRTHLHFRPWRDMDGQWHSGLLTDINMIQKALIAALNNERTEPRTVPPLKADFIDPKFMKEKP